MSKRFYERNAKLRENFNLSVSIEVERSIFVHKILRTLIKSYWLSANTSLFTGVTVNERVMRARMGSVSHRNVNSHYVHF